MIKFENVSKKFGEVVALKDISFKINAGEFVFLIGPSGAGKTTLIRLILREYLSSSGAIEVAGMDLTKMPRKKIPQLRKMFGVVFQDLKLLPDLTVFENVAFILRFLGEGEEKIKTEVLKMLELVGLSARKDFFPAQLAGGELQRVCLARAVVAKPEVIIADEPTGNLDIGTARQVVEILKKINQMGKTVIMATHNFEIVNSFAERVIEFDQGKIISDKKKGKYPRI